ncbi:serine/threonine protein phosphatase [Kaustia mangrovi]|uniref:Serine/threonine protein phosphatase n=1 Tax=Kaustia mangrovi TaxID=2593653 RepID=A0A7S8HCG3_9HYPH|nr:metallophosphoesterase family protein [Kaustia mangrovi]QPC43692.1 serine/threonine protein phosphatase [Kaustia mangrovi]
MIFSRRFGSARTAKPHHRLPPGTRAYAVGDIHGRMDCLAELLDRIAEDDARSPAEHVYEIYLGDYVDRGPQSREVIETLRAPASGGRERVCLRGNHEAVLSDCLADPGAIAHWLQFGGFETLLSYGVTPDLKASERDANDLHDRLNEAFPDTHRAFLRDLRPSFALSDYLFVHAGIRPGVALDRQSAEDLLWIREPFLGSTADHGKRIVHGHTPVDAPELLPNRVNIDTGAFMTGRLTCAVIEGTDIRFIQTG